MEISGYPVLSIQPNFARPPMPRGRRGFDLADFSQAPRYVQFLGQVPLHTLHLEFLLFDQEIHDFDDFFHARRGKWGRFFLPSWHAEIHPVAGIMDTESELSIAPVGYGDIYLVGEEIERLGHHIFLAHQDGDLHVSRVASVSGSDPEVLTLATPVERDFLAGEFIVGLLYWGRFLQDELEMEFTGRLIAKANVAFTELDSREGGAEAPFDGTDCEVELGGDSEGGGGTTFDCYAEQEDFDGTPEAGTGISDMVAADSPYGVISGDTFDSYDAEESPITQTLDAGGGLGDWVHGDGP